MQTFDTDTSLSFVDIVKFVPSHQLSPSQSFVVFTAWFQYHQHNSGTFRKRFTKLQDWLDWTVLEEVVVRQAPRLTLLALIELGRTVRIPTPVVHACLSVIAKSSVQALAQTNLRVKLNPCIIRSRNRKRQQSCDYPKTHERLKYNEMLETSLAYSHTPHEFSCGFSRLLVPLIKTETDLAEIFVSNHTKIWNMYKRKEFCSLCRHDYDCDFHTRPVILIPTTDRKQWEPLYNPMLAILDKISFDGYNRIQTLYFLETFVFAHRLEVRFSRFSKLCSQTLFCALQKALKPYPLNPPCLVDQIRIWNEVIAPYPIDDPTLCIFLKLPFGSDCTVFSKIPPHAFDITTLEKS